MKEFPRILPLAFLTLILLAMLTPGKSQTRKQFTPGMAWNDIQGDVINAHGGCVLYSRGTYYWFGEKRGQRASEGVNVYSSKDLYNWKAEGLALAPENSPESDITRSCLMERPKVIYNEKTGKYVMWFHLELKGQGYNAARAAVAISDNPTGPFKFLKSFRPNGNMSRDMTLFVDKDQSAYHIYSSRDNYDLRIARLTDDYLTPTTQDKLLFSQHREAPAIFRHNDLYYMVASGCTGWAPNKASVHVASSLWGPWEDKGDPMHGPDAATTFGGQSTFILPVQGKKNKFIFMADRWNPKDLKDSRYLWLPAEVTEGKLSISWHDSWKL
jgi:beta-galactosidase